MRFLPLLLIAGLSLLAAATLPAAQKSKSGDSDDWRLDPYTQKDPELMKKLGYESFGPIHEWGDGHGTRAIEKTLGNVDMIWVETEHFKIGSSLPEYKIGRNKKERAKLKEELERLQEFFPDLDPKSKKLDRWLRLHLFAMRAEDLYQDVCERLGVSDEDFPTEPGVRIKGKYMGQGPYLGQSDKYTILLFEKASSFGRYYGMIAGTHLEIPKRHNFQQVGSLFFGTSTEFSEGALKNDTALHCHLVFSVVQNLIDGYKFYTHDIPLWMKEGLAHWFARQVSPEHNNFSNDPKEDEESRNMRDEWNWEPKVRARVKHDYYPKTEKMMGVRSYDDFKFSDHMMIWSRIDYLMSLGDEGFAKYMDLMNGEIDGKLGNLPPDRIYELQESALVEAWGMTPAKIDENWKEYVKDNYPVK